LRDGEKTPFWEAPWLDGIRPIDIAPLVYNLSSRKNWCVKQALRNEGWIAKIKMTADLSLEHIRQYINLWIILRHVNLREGVADDIVWTLTEDGQYSAKSAYNAQFYGSTTSPPSSSVWKIWAPPKVKFFAWLVIQNRIWTADRLAKRGWPNCGSCPLCQRAPESVLHLFVHCRYTNRLWGLVKDWLGIDFLDQQTWQNQEYQTWWSDMTKRKDLASLTLLLSWEVWNERNARVFNNKHAPPSVLLENIKCEARLWVLAGAKRLSNLMPRE
jgi:hypothetical protein